MSRYIDADKIEMLIADYQLAISNDILRYNAVDDVIGMIEDAPTADVVEVVRCRDCRYHCRPYAPLEDDIYCGMAGYLTWHDGNEDYFCADGARKEHE